MSMFKTIKDVLPLAKQCKTKHEFRTRFGAACNESYRHGWIKDLEQFWVSRLLTDEPRSEIIKAAKKAGTKVSFQYNFSRQYKAAKAQGILQEIYELYIPEGRKPNWTYETAAEAAKLYTTRKAFQYGNHRGAYQWLRINKLLDKACDAAGIKNVRRYWSDQDLIDECKQYTSIVDLIENDPGIRTTVERRGLETVAFAHFVRPDTATASDYDAIYLWRSDIKVDGNWVYKVGLTSHRLGEDRIRKVATAAGTTAKILILCKTTCNAIHVERLIKKFGTRPTLKWFNGYKEFRVMTAAQVRQVMAIIKQHAAA